MSHQSLYILTILTIISISQTIIKCSVIVSVSTGTILSSYKSLNAAISHVDLVFQIDDVENTATVHYPKPCAQKAQLDEVLDYFYLNIQWTDQQYEELISLFNVTCERFRKARMINVRFRKMYNDSIETYKDIISHLTPGNKLVKRSIGSTIRNMFGIASRQRQQKLITTIESLSDDMFTIQGKLQNYAFVIELQSQRMKHLEQNMKHYEATQNVITQKMQNLEQHQVQEHIMSQFQNILLHDLINKGILYNQILSEQNVQYRIRANAMAHLAKGYLPINLITPHILKNTLAKLKGALQNQYPLVQMTQNRLYEYYANAKVASYVTDDNIYVSIPVFIDLHSQKYNLFKIETFCFRIPESVDLASVIKPDYNIIGINDRQQTYTLIDEQYLAHHCTGDSVLRCDDSKIIPQYPVKNRPSCELGLYTKNITMVKGMCNIGVVPLDNTIGISMYNLRNGSFLVSNPNQESVFLNCRSYRHETFLSDKPMFTIQIQCFCWIYSQTYMSPTFIHNNCLQNSTVSHKIDTHENLLYLSMYLNQSIGDFAHNASFWMKIEPLALPEQKEGLQLDGNYQQSILDLRKILEHKSSNYENTISGRLSIHSRQLNSYFLMKIFACISPVAIVISIGIYFTIGCKFRKFSHILSIAGLIKHTEALDVTNTNCNVDNDIWQSIGFIVEIFSIVATCCALLYIILKNFHLITRVTRYGALPFTDCMSISMMKPLQIMLYIASIDNHCILSLTEMNYIPPHLVTVILNGPVMFQMHRTLCSAYLLQKEGGITLEISGIKKSKLNISGTVSIPIYLRSTVADIVKHLHAARILIGSNEVYTSTILPIKEEDININVEDSK